MSRYFKDVIADRAAVQRGVMSNNQAVIEAAAKHINGRVLARGRHWIAADPGVRFPLSGKLVLHERFCRHLRGLLLSTALVVSLAET